MTQVTWLFVFFLISLQSTLSETKNVVEWNEDLPSDNSAKENLPLDKSPKENLPLDNSSKENLPLDNSSKEKLPLDKSPRENRPLDKSAKDNLPLDNSARVRKENVDNSSHSKTLLKEDEGKSSFAVRTRKDSSGGKIECYMNYESNSTDTNDVKCGIQYQYEKMADGSVNCIGSIVTLAPLNGAENENGAGHALFETGVNAKKDVYIVSCACGTSFCNEKGKAWDCLENAIGKNCFTIAKDISNDTLDHLVQCITKNETFTDVVNRYTTTTTSTTTTTTTTTSTTTTTTSSTTATIPPAAQTEKSDNTNLYIISAVCVTLLLVIIVLLVIMIIRK